MSKDVCSEICVHFGVDSVENSVANQQNRFIKRTLNVIHYLLFIYLS